jgi:hypothetical protein
MARRILAWLLVTPFAVTGIFAAHALAYGLTGTNARAVHGYLEHAPQVLAVLASIGLVGLAVQERSVGRVPWSVFAALAPAGFAVQEHLERFAHTGDVPFLLTSPSFLLGLALQAPVALVCVLVARRVAGTLADVRSSSAPVIPDGAWLPLTSRAAVAPRSNSRPRPAGRGPPLVLAS